MQDNKVTKTECMRAIKYLFQDGFLDEMHGDKKYFTTILLKKVAKDYNIDLVWDTVK
jgi:hypothetical protein